jgi:hypothetical protein
MLLISILLVALYIGGYIWKHKELPNSISAMIYELEGSKRYIWQIWLALVTVGIAPTLFEATKDNPFQFIAFFTIAGLMMVSGLPLVRKEKNKAHGIIAICSGILSQVSVTMVCAWWLLVWLPLILIMCCFYFNAFGANNRFFKAIEGKGIFLAELACTISQYGSLLTFLV